MVGGGRAGTLLLSYPADSTDPGGLEREGRGVISFANCRGMTSAGSASAAASIRVQRIAKGGTFSSSNAFRMIAFGKKQMPQTRHNKQNSKAKARQYLT